MYTPREIVDYIYKEKLDSDFLVALSYHKGNYSIGEITDKQLTMEEGVCRFRSAGYRIDLPVQDEDIITATTNGLYVSAFISRHGERYQVHFLVHSYPISMKSRFEEQILEEVIRYMIMKTVIALRLDTPEKVRAYAGK